MEGAARRLDPRTLDVAARLAGALARPLDLLRPERCGLGPLSGAELRAIAAHPCFRAPVNRAVARGLELDRVAMGRSDIERMGASARSRLAVLVATQPEEALRRAGRLVGAAVLHRRVLRLALKAERARAREVLGEDGFQIATQEAPLLHPGLAELDSAEASILAADAEAGASRERLALFGWAILCAFVEAAEPLLHPFAEARLPAERAAGIRLREAHGEHIVRLLRRRMGAWSPIIA